MKKLFITVFCTFVLFACAGKSNKSVQDINTTTETEVNISDDTPCTPLTPLYVLSNQEGTKFLLIPEDNTIDSEVLKQYKYIIFNGSAFPVVFKGFQEGDPENDSGRETPYNFDNLAGWLFEMESGKLLNNPTDEYDAIWDAPLLVDACFYRTVSQPFFSGRLNPGEEPFTKELQDKIEQQFGWKVLKGSVDYVFGEGAVYKWINVQFENKGEKALALAGVLMPDGRVIAKTFPANWNEESVWRVDDMGEFGGLGLDLVTEEDGVLTFYTYNMGAEGTNYQSYVIDGDSLREGKCSASFYQAPE